MSNGTLQVIQNVSANLRRARQQRGLSQDRLAELAGISRRMLVNIEAGESNVSIATVDKLASALGLAFLDVVGAPAPADKVHSALPLRIWQGKQADSHGNLLESLNRPGMTVELWQWQLAAGDSYQAEADAPGCHEMLHVYAGELEVRLPDRVRKVGTGQSLAFASDVTYTYHNPAQALSCFSKSIIMYPHRR
ncbi:helix-turn-helix domain-containing protein [Paludibacterium yongneupense]|uniref:helix-turn-helix domain-containing protein n=1 Tax=Paludibacterium yongneupense TaxID=400061 RepID=UPI000420A701|nr:XRE family transcriptional regulator [Paludibacterium yongneupense]